MGFILEKTCFFFKMTKCGELAVDCVSNGFTSGKRLSRFMMFFRHKLDIFESWERRNYDGERVFFRQKNEFIFLRSSLKKWKGAKQAGDSLPACYFAAYSSEFGKRSIPPKCVRFLPNVGKLSSRKIDIGPRFWKQFVKIAKRARVAKMAKKTDLAKKAEMVKIAKEPKWPNWPYVYSGQNGLIGQNCHTRQNGQSD